MAGKKPGMGGPRLSSFGKNTNKTESQSPDDMKVPDRMLYKMVGGRPATVVPGGGPSVAPNENAGRPDPGLRKKRNQFTQRYYQPSTKHPDYLHGSPDGRRMGDESGGSQ